MNGSLRPQVDVREAVGKCNQQRKRDNIGEAAETEDRFSVALDACVGGNGTDKSWLLGRLEFDVVRAASRLAGRVDESGREWSGYMSSGRWLRSNSLTGNWTDET